MSPLRPARSGLVAAMIAASLGVASAPALAREGVRVLSSDAARLSFEVDAAPVSLAPAPGRAWQTIALPGFELEGVGGTPALPVRIVAIAVPPEGEPTVSAVGEGPEVREGVVLAPAARLGDGPGAAPWFEQDPAAYARAAPMRPLRAEVLEVGWWRDQRIARIAIHPVDYEPAARRLTTFRRVRVEVSFPASRAGEPAPVVDDPFERGYRTALVNAGQGRAWRRVGTPAGEPAMTRAQVAPLGVEDPPLPDSSLFTGRMWVKIAVPASGFYRVDFSQLRGLALFDQVDTMGVQRLRLYAWNGPSVLPTVTFCDSCDYREVAIGVVDGDNDGRFGTNFEDYFYFYALGINEWADRFDPAEPDTAWSLNPHETRNYYFLTLDTFDAPMPGPPQRIAVEPVAASSADPIETTFPERLHYETDVEYFPNVSPRHRNPLGFDPWEQWVWRSVGQNSSFTPVGIAAPGADTTQPARLRVSVTGLTLNEAPGCFPSIPDHFADITFNGQALPRLTFENYERVTVDTLLTGLSTAVNAVTVSVPAVFDASCVSRFDRVGLSWVELWYPRRFEPVDDRLAFRSPATPPAGGTVHYRLAPFSRPELPRLFDVTDPAAPVELQLPAASWSAIPEGWALEFARAESGVRRYQVLPGTGGTFDSTFTRLENSRLTETNRTSFMDLRADTLSAEYLIVYYDGFESAAAELMAWREQSLPGNRPAPHQVRRIPISAVYDQFSGGRLDPGAVRAFMRNLYYPSALRATRTPTFVMLLGDASFDPRNILGRNNVPTQPASLIPSFEEGWDRAVVRQFATDDWLLNVDNTATVNILPEYIGGRLPAGTAAEALDIVRNKVLLYEREAPLDEARNRIVLLADDDEQGDSFDPLGWTHLRQTSDLEREHTPAHLDRRYVYLHKFPDGPGGTKPAAKNRFIAEVNQGSVIVNYVGHGSPIQLTDEKVFLDSDTGTLTNGANLAIFIAASCDVGKFNDPTLPSLGERLLTHQGGGAVAVISATELAFSYQNEQLNKELYDALFSRDSTLEQGHYHVTLSEALRAAKVGGAINDQKYQLLGDPATRPNLPREWAEITLRDSTGAPVTSLERGSRVWLEGVILDAPPGFGGDSLSLDGQASVLVEDSAPIELPPGVVDPQFQYRYEAGTIYRGNVQLRGGRFSGSFIVPLDANEGPNSRVRAYITGLPPVGVEVDGAGHRVTAVTPGTGSGTDVTGPRIELAFVGGATQVRAGAVLQVHLFDESGILTTGRTPQNGIVVTLDDNTTNRADITPTFRYAADSYQSGTATWTLPELEPGPHRVRVSAADNLALGLDAARHRSSATLEFEVVDSPGLRVTRAYLMPNPAESGGPRSGATFVVDAPGEPVNVMVRIYTATGRLVRTLESFGGLAQIQLAWDGRDAEGDALANGTYFFRVHVNGRDADGSSSAGRRADAEGRFVILNH